MFFGESTRVKTMKSIARDCLPPILLSWIRRAWRSDDIQFNGEYLNWDDACTQCSGYDAEEILAKVLNATLKVKRGESKFERDSVLFDEIEYAWPVLSGLMWAAARNGGQLNVLDFGGALGSSYFQNRRFLQSLSEVCWNVVEQTHYVEAGRAHIQDKQLMFYKTIDECLINNRPNVILLSSVLQYLQSPMDVIKKLQNVGATCLIIDRTSFSNLEDNQLLVQKVSSAICFASYPMWVFSYKAFMNMLENDWVLVSPTPSPEGCVRSQNGLEFTFQGMLLESH